MEIASCGNNKDHPTRPGPSSRPFFFTSHQKLRELQATTTDASYHAANHVNQQAANHVYRQETIDAISNLATATPSDLVSVATLTATNSSPHRRAHAEQQQAGHRPPGCCPYHRHHCRTAPETRKSQPGYRARGRMGQTPLLLDLWVCLQALQSRLPQPCHWLSERRH